MWNFHLTFRTLAKCSGYDHRSWSLQQQSLFCFAVVYNVKSRDIFTDWFGIFCLGCKICIRAVSFRILPQTFSHSLLADTTERTGEVRGSWFHSQEILQKITFPRQKHRVCSAIRWTKTVDVFLALVCRGFLNLKLIKWFPNFVKQQLIIIVKTTYIAL